MIKDRKEKDESLHIILKFIIIFLNILLLNMYIQYIHIYINIF